MTAAVANGYAEALFRSAVELDCVETVSAELPLAREMLARQGDFFNNPQINVGKTSQALRDVMAGKFHSLTVEFVLLLVQHHHIRKLTDIAARFKQLSDYHLGLATVKLRTPFEVSAETLERMKDRLIQLGLVSERFIKNIGFEVTVDKDVIGGFIAYFDGYQIDASLKTAVSKINRPERYGTT